MAEAWHLLEQLSRDIGWELDGLHMGSRAVPDNVVSHCSISRWLPRSLTGVGLVTALAAALLPRPFAYMLLYPAFRLLFGTLYPAYASYKAVRTKDVKEYVSFFSFFEAVLTS